jgi:HEAT repeat protein
MIKGLSDRELGVRLNCANSLHRLGPDAKPAVPGLILALEDEDFLVQRRAAEAIGSIGPAASSAVLPLAKLFLVQESRASQTRESVLEALQKITPSGPQAAAELETYSGFDRSSKEERERSLQRIQEILNP